MSPSEYPLRKQLPEAMAGTYGGFLDRFSIGSVGVEKRMYNRLRIIDIVSNSRLDRRKFLERSFILD